MAAVVRVGGEDIELDYPLIDGALDLMALTCGNNLDQETIRKAEKLKRIVAQRLEGESRNMKLRVNFTAGPNEPSTSLFEPRPPSSRALDQPASISRARLGPSSAISTKESRQRARPSLPAGIQDLTGLYSVPIRKHFDVCKARAVQANVAGEADKKTSQTHTVYNKDIKRGIPVTVYGPDGREGNTPLNSKSGAKQSTSTAKAGSKSAKITGSVA